MSSLAVRNALRAAWSGITPAIPYVETINTTPPESEVAVPIWATFMFEGQGSDHQTMGSRPWIEESGVAIIVIMAFAGVGDDEVAAAADDMVRGWTNWIDSTGNIWISSVDPPRSPDGEAVGDVYRLTVGLNYRYQTRGGS